MGIAERGRGRTPKMMIWYTAVTAKAASGLVIQIDTRYANNVPVYAYSVMMNHWKR